MVGVYSERIIIMKFMFTCLAVVSVPRTESLITLLELVLSGYLRFHGILV